MSDYKKIGDLLREKIINAKSEDEAKKLFIELKPQIEKLTEKFFSENISDSNTKENDINWIDELYEYITNTIQLFLLYHIKGELKHIRLSLSEKLPPHIYLTIDEQNYFIDFNTFKNGTTKKNRDEHRECYYRNESIWNEYRSFSTCFNITTTGEELCNKLKVAFPLVTIDYIIA